MFSVRYAVPRDRASQRVLEAHEYRCAPAWVHPTIPLDDVVSDMLDRGREIRPEFYEWLMDWPQDWTAPAGDRAARIRICGGGVMAAQAVAAFKHLVKFVKVLR